MQSEDAASDGHLNGDLIGVERHGESIKDFLRLGKKFFRESMARFGGSYPDFILGNLASSESPFLKGRSLPRMAKV